jgi:hypothetical protein
VLAKRFLATATPAATTTAAPLPACATESSATAASLPATESIKSASAAKIAAAPAESAVEAAHARSHRSHSSTESPTHSATTHCCTQGTHAAEAATPETTWLKSAGL